MAIDIQAKLAELRAKKAAEQAQATETNAAIVAATTEVQKPISTVAVVVPNTEPINKPIAVAELGITNNQAAEVAGDKAVAEAISKQQPTTNTIGTTRTSEIDHLDFMSKMGELKDAILHQHPKMPVLLMLIHKQLRADPELVTTLSEEEIGDIVNGLKIQTKTELTGTIVKQTKSRDKKTKLDADMF